LNLKSLENLSNPTFLRILSFCKQLEYFNLSHCKKLNNISLSIALDVCKNLTTLILCNCLNLNEAAFLKISETETIKKKLKNLDLSFCPFITDEIVNKILINCKQLESLNISYARNLTYAAVSNMLTMENVLKLNSLDFKDGNEAIERSKMMAIGTKFPSMRIYSSWYFQNVFI
jgi:hypothetical protein